MLKKIFRRVRKAVRDVGSFAEDNPLVTLAGLGIGLGSGIMPGGADFGLKTLLGNVGKLGSTGRNLLGGFDKVVNKGVMGDVLEQGTGILGTGQDILGALTNKDKFSGIAGIISSLITKNALEEEAAAIREERRKQQERLDLVSNKFNSFTGGSPDPNERFDVLPEGVEYILDEEGNITGRTDNITYSAQGGIAQLNMGGNPQNRMHFNMPVRRAMGGNMNGSSGIDPQIFDPSMSGKQMMNKIEENPGITSFFPPKMGMINGPGGPKDDKIPAMLSNGEFVFTAKAVDNAGGPRAMYNMMNKLDPESSKGKGIA